VECWHGYLPGASCSLAYGPADATVSCFSKIQIGFTFLLPAHPGSPGQRAVKRVCVCVCPCPTVKFGYSGLSYNRYSIIRHFFWSQLIISVGDDTVIKDSVRMDLHLVQTRGPIYKICYDYLMIMPKLRSTHDGRLIYKTSYEGHKAFLRYDSLAVL